MGALSGTNVEPEPCRESACLAINDCFFGRCARPIESYEDRTTRRQSGTYVAAVRRG